MTRTKLVMIVVALTICLSAAGSAMAGSLVPEGQGPWTQAIYGNDGRLVAARGMEGRDMPLLLSSESELMDGRLRARITFQRGEETLDIERTFDGTLGVDTVYESGEERLVISLVRDDLTGEALAVYRLPDGEVFSLWITEDGEILNGDISGLRRALRKPLAVTRLIRSYARHTADLEGDLPSSGETMLMQQISCEDLCAEDCDRQCALECAFGLPFCRLCKISCAIGCIIGCS